MRGRDGTVRVNLRAATDVPNFSLYDHGRVYGLELLDSLASRAGIPREWQRGQIEHHGIEARLHRFQGLRQRVRVVGIQEDGKIEFFTQTLHDSRKLPRSHKLPFSLRCANQNRHVQLTRSLEDTFQQDEIRDVEVPNGDTVSSCFLNYFNEFLHGCFPNNHVQARCHHLAGIVGSGPQWWKMHL